MPCATGILLRGANNVAVYPKRILSLFAGIAGLDLGIRLVFPESRTVCFVERESYAASVLVARMEDKTLDEAPIWSDVTTFDASCWNGVVDTVSFGFPCQDLSVAGKRKGIKQGTRSGLFFEACRIIRQVQPRYLFIENVTGLLSNKFMSVVLGELSEMGFDAEWGVFSARDVGSTHLRKRVFILGYSHGGRNL
jgi:DNA (cytosine-5)-methyltransferase 1